MLPLLTADASEKVVGSPPIDHFNRLEAAARSGPFGLPSDSDDTGRDLYSVGIMSGCIVRFLSPFTISHLEAWALLAKGLCIGVAQRCPGALIGSYLAVA
jgi:hypothetical protein